MSRHALLSAKNKQKVASLRKSYSVLESVKWQLLDTSIILLLKINNYLCRPKEKRVPISNALSIAITLFSFGWQIYGLKEKHYGVMSPHPGVTLPLECSSVQKKISKYTACQYKSICLYKVIGSQFLTHFIPYSIYIIMSQLTDTYRSCRNAQKQDKLSQTVNLPTFSNMLYFITQVPFVGKKEYQLFQGHSYHL